MGGKFPDKKRFFLSKSCNFNSVCANILEETNLRVIKHFFNFKNNTYIKKTQL